jgi:hypothetical protein
MSKLKTLNDQVEDIHIALYNNEQYRAFLGTAYNGRTVEGSLVTDIIMATQMIRDEAKRCGSGVAKEKLARIRKALGVVLRRYDWPAAPLQQNRTGEIR